MDQISIGKFIAQKRKEQNLTQEQLAERLGCFKQNHFKMGKQQNVCPITP